MMFEGNKTMVTSLRPASLEVSASLAVDVVRAETQVHMLVGVRVMQLSLYISPTRQQIAPFCGS